MSKVRRGPRIVVHDESGSSPEAVRILNEMAASDRNDDERERVLAALALTPRQRVQLHPGTDRWMMGDRYGEVVKVTPKGVLVRLDRSGKTLRFRSAELLPIP